MMGYTDSKSQIDITSSLQMVTIERKKNHKDTTRFPEWPTIYEMAQSSCRRQLKTCSHALIYALQAAWPVSFFTTMKLVMHATFTGSHCLTQKKTLWLEITRIITSPILLFMSLIKFPSTGTIIQLDICVDVMWIKVMAMFIS